MHNHFDKYFNLKGLILEKRPRSIVECGAGGGMNTRKIQTLLNEYPFDFYVISDSEIEGKDDRVTFIKGISYIELEKFPDNSIDLCIIDTDHNYWTFQQEMLALRTKLCEGAYIVVHDVDAFYYNTGMAMTYGDGTEYPAHVIQDTGIRKGGLGTAVMDLLSMNRFDYRLIYFTWECNGVALIQRKTVTEAAICIPGGKAVYTGSNQAEKEKVYA